LNKQKALLEKSVEIKTSELQEKNGILIKQAEKLNQSNVLLEERQMEIESQKEELVTQHEILVNMNNELHSLNVSKDKFFSIIAHDLKNPFSTIIGFSEILKEDISSGHLDEIEESATMINTSAVQTYRLLENLLEWAKAQRGKLSFNPEPVDLNILLNEEIKILSEMAKPKNIALESYIPENIRIVADQNMIKTILRNLISNAIKFTHRNGKVEVKVIAENQHINISVADTGIGMTDDIIAKIFRIDSDLSTLGTDNEKGTGLGLFLCKEFVEKHNGKIWVESVSGKGSTFTFALPSSVLSS
jgi:signal transduction histidine kinase